LTKKKSLAEEIEIFSWKY